jgi:hypothetical protein
MMDDEHTFQARSLLHRQTDKDMTEKHKRQKHGNKDRRKNITRVIALLVQIQF